MIAPTQKDCRQLMDALLCMATARGASDLHLAPFNPPVLRIDGRLVREGNPLTPEEVEVLITSMAPAHALESLERGDEADYAVTASNGARFRVNAYRCRGYLCAAYRLIPARVPTFESLGLPPQLRQFTELDWGLVLVTGPTGSGKSTTLAALIDLINRSRPVHVVTLEDPIEYLHESKVALISQREIGKDSKSFASALRALLREDPDVVLIGEMRDLETISTALTVAETGHLVFATLHTNNAPQTVDRIIDVFPPEQQEQIRTQLAMVLKGVISQRLLPRIGGGRVAVFEIMVGTPAVANLIKERKTAQLVNVIQTGSRYGMQTLEQSIRATVQRGLIHPDDVRPYLSMP